MVWCSAEAPLLLQVQFTVTKTCIKFILILISLYSSKLLPFYQGHYECNKSYCNSTNAFPRWRAVWTDKNQVSCCYLVANMWTRLSLSVNRYRESQLKWTNAKFEIFLALRIRRLLGCVVVWYQRYMALQPRRPRPKSHWLLTTVNTLHK